MTLKTDIGDEWLVIPQAWIRGRRMRQKISAY